ncbi:hypothetical protein BD289DRAFT_359345 [Coniella lustricola]|uniref:Zn(2)-C6 fungal-type domain-containing protein n=1 Tax=Coniella lustricola TaxID=2025994 RepID=A0A2T3ALF6_9PEZI|nr:hypothetical protein BD289DRAFT_359345 [Coniella lustricola]
MDLQPTSSAKPRIPYACEACRAAKVKCQPSTTADTCQRCAASKRECVFKTGPRTRRRRSKFHPAATRSTPPPSAPSKTFTIDVPMSEDMSGDLDASESFDVLRDTHESSLEKILPDEYQAPNGSRPVLRSAPASTTSGRGTTSSSTPSAASQSMHGLSSIQPQFNLESATSLLEIFRNGMLPWFPVLILEPDASVSSLARERPFVLLAILSAASASRSLQGHNLYDEEFRKVLGLKFVSGSERSLELLVGLLIYTAWYPFHLRPKSRQAMQYHQMAVDIVRDLELDQEPDEPGMMNMVTDADRLAGIRAYLASYFLCSSFSATWRKPQKILYQQWTTTCCDILVKGRDKNDAATIQDEKLTWLVRLGHSVEQTAMMNDPKHPARHDQQHSLLVIKGVEAQLREWQSRIPSEILSQPAVYLANLTAEIMLCGYPLMQFPHQKLRKHSLPPQTYYAESSRLERCVTLLRTWYDYTSALSAADYNQFPGINWANFVMTVILGLRLSFPIHDVCPDWDHTAARQVLEFGMFLDKFVRIGDFEPSSNLAPSSSKRLATSDILSASKVVIEVVKRKYDGRWRALQETTLDMNLDRSFMSCPMLDGSLSAYLPEWAEASLGADSLPLNTQMGTYVAGLGTSDSGGQPGSSQWSEAQPQDQPVIFHDLWATMTMDWSQHGCNSEDCTGF